MAVYATTKVLYFPKA